MDRYQMVESLQPGDKFAFLAAQKEGASPAVMVVMRKPSVNPAAGSCHFRYQPDMAPGDAVRRWDETHSWNGTTGVKVLMLNPTALEKPQTPTPVPQPIATKPPAEKPTVTKTVVRKVKLPTSPKPAAARAKAVARPKDGKETKAIVSTKAASRVKSAKVAKSAKPVAKRKKK